MTEIPQPIHNQQLGTPTREMLHGQTMVINSDSPALQVPGGIKDPTNVLAGNDLVAVVGAGTYGSPQFKQIAVVRGLQGYGVAELVPAQAVDSTETNPKAKAIASTFAVEPGTITRFVGGLKSQIGELEDGVAFSLAVGQDATFRIQDGYADGRNSRTGLQVITAGLKPIANETVAPVLPREVVGTAVARAVLSNEQERPDWSMKEKPQLTETGPYDKKETHRLEAFIRAQGGAIDNPQVRRHMRTNAVALFMDKVQAEAEESMVSERFAAVVSAYAAGSVLRDYAATEQELLKKADEGLRKLPDDVAAKMAAVLWDSSEQSQSSVYDKAHIQGDAEGAAAQLVDMAVDVLGNADVTEADKVYGTALLAVATGLRGKHTSHRLIYYMSHAKLAPHKYIG